MRSKVLLLVVFLLWLLTKNVEAAGTIGLPFREGQVWTVCRGYNIDGDQFHDNVPVLDLTIGHNPVGPNGCIGDAKASEDKEVIAPGDGTIHYFGSDGLCLDLTNGGALGILHFNTRWPDGATIKKGEVLGKLAGPNSSNGNYSHIHIQAHETNCQGALRPFTEENGFRFENNPNLPYNGTYNQWAGDSSNPTIPQWFSATWHPNGTMVREVATQAVWYLENGLRRGITSEETILSMGRDPKEVIAVSSREISCWPRGEDIPLIPDSLFGFGWNGSKAGTLVRQIGTNPVYQVGDDCFLHWLNITEAEFYSFGYNSSIIRDVPSVWNIGNPIVKEDFQRCNKVVISVDNFTSTGTGKYVAVRIGPDGGMGGGFEGVPAFVFGSPADMPNDYVSTGGRQFNVREQFSDILISSDGMLRNQRLYEVELRKISTIY